MRYAACLAIGLMLTTYRSDLPISSGAESVMEARFSVEGLLSGFAMPPGSASPPSTIRRRPREQLPSGQEAFDRLWKGHPHVSQASEDVRAAHGLPDSMEHTCAIRLSIMLNNSKLTITPEKTQAAGIKRKPHYSTKTKQYYILSAREIWTYLAKYYRAADIIFPASGKYASAEEFQKEFDSTIKPIISKRKGIVAFEKLFSYDGTGHVDLFDGETLSDSITWYPCTRLHVWYVVVP